MKYLLVFLLPVFVKTGYAQKTPVTDSFAMNLSASLKNALRFVYDTKKDGAFFTRELVSVNEQGEPSFAAAFPMPGFNAFITKGRTDIKKGLTYWSWSIRFIEAPKGEKAAEIEALAAKADSIIIPFKSYIAEDKPHAAGNIFVSKVINYQYSNSNYASLIISFRKPLFQTEQEVYDSLISLYKPLMSDPGNARAATRQFCYAFLREDYPERKAVAAIREVLPVIAGQDIKAAYGVCMGFPYFVKYDAVKDVLSYQQQEQLKKMAEQTINEWEAEKKRLFGKTEPVVAQQKKTEMIKNAKACVGYVNETSLQPGMLTKGYAVSGTVDNKPFTGMFTDIDCAKAIVFIRQPGPVNQVAGSKTIQVNISNYKNYWRPSKTQYRTCSRCGGAGGDYVTETTSKTKELPFGYFEGITTTSTRTTSKTYLRYCSKCNGTGLALE